MVRKDKCHDEPQSFTESFCQYYRDMVEKSKSPGLGSQQYPIKESSNQRVKSSGIRRKIPLTKGQQLYLLGKYHVNKKIKFHNHSFISLKFRFMILMIQNFVELILMHKF